MLTFTLGFLIVAASPTRAQDPPRRILGSFTYLNIPYNYEFSIENNRSYTLNIAPALGNNNTEASESSSEEEPNAVPETPDTAK